MTKLLLAVTGDGHWTLADGTKHPTGFWAEELVAPHRIFHDAGYDMTIATPGGVTPTVDQASLTPAMNGGDEQAVAALRDYLDAIAPELQAAVPLEEVDPADFDLIFLPGGHGPMEDLAVFPPMGEILVAMLDDGKPVVAVCHAPAALLAARRPDGSWPFAGFRLTAFTDEEERQAGLADRAPWLLEDRLRERGANFDAGEAWAPHLVSDRNLHTGQNPASSGPLAEHVVEHVVSASSAR